MILDRIVSAKRAEIAERRARVPEQDMEKRAMAVPPRGGFVPALRPRQRGADIRLIAEVKKASPSKGLIRPDFDPVAIARSYQDAGAAAVSVLTDREFFQGSLDHMRSVASGVRVPVLRKDFILDRYQLLEAREAGASAVLLIAAILNDRDLALLMAESRALGLETLVEVHSSEELARVLATDAPAIGINNRDLATFQVDIETTLRLRPQIPADRLAVSESGIFTREHVLRLQAAHVDAVLVGESLMRRPDPGDGVRELLGAANKPAPGPHTAG